MASPRLTVLTDLATGATISAAGGFSPWDGSRWRWIAAAVADRYGCDPEDVDFLETDDGDQVSARGVPVAGLAW